MACVCPDIEQRERDKTMDFSTEVTGDALDFMQDVWDDKKSFTRAELGGAPDWAEYVNAAGELFPSDMGDEYCEMLTELYGMVSVCGYQYEAGATLAEMDPIAFRCGMLDWLDMCVQDGDLRRIED